MKKDKLPKPISLLILTLLTAVVWISLSIYRAIAVKPVADISQGVSSPITPTLNKNAIDDIESSIYLDDSQIPQNIITTTSTSIPVPTVSPTSTPESTESGAIEEEI